MANIKFDGLIPAIKAVRAIPLATVSLERNSATGHLELRQQALGLKEAKDLVEAIMAMGVQRFLEDALAKARGGSVSYPPYDDDIRF